MPDPQSEAPIRDSQGCSPKMHGIKPQGQITMLISAKPAVVQKHHWKACVLSVMFS